MLHIIFDGDQAFLLPAPFYIYDDEGIKESVGTIRFTFDIPKDWMKVVPFDRIDNPGWNDIYAIHKNAFVFGMFDKIMETEAGFRVYVPAGAVHTETSGFKELFAYFVDLFASAPPEYSVVLLPPDNRGERVIGGGDIGLTGDRIIGGAGTAVTAASFDYNKLRDWQLLSHRMFHAFYDTTAPYYNAHVPPNVWLNEGLSTYYENMSMGALPEHLKSMLGVDVNGRFALILCWGPAFRRYGI